jgi:hypothetical protein
MTGGTTAIVGCVAGGGRFAAGGTDAAPEGGARLTAPPGSGTDAGGIGGGRSLNNCALAGSAATKKGAKANISHSRARRTNPMLASPPEIMVPAFQRKRGKFKPSRPKGRGQEPSRIGALVATTPQNLPNRLQTRHKLFLPIVATSSRRA